MASRSIDDDEIRSVEAFLAKLRSRDPGDNLKVGIVRDDQRLTVPVVLAECPAG